MLPYWVSAEAGKKRVVFLLGKELCTERGLYFWSDFGGRYEDPESCPEETVHSPDPSSSMNLRAGGPGVC